MTIEEMLKEHILSNYRSVLEFTESINMPYGTMQSIFKRGIQNSSIANIFKICTALGISADELGEGRIAPIGENIQRKSHMTDIDTIIAFTKKNIQDYDDLTIGGQPMTENEIETLLDAIDIAIGIIKRNRGRNIII